jgi:hypothetical protein
MEPDQRVETPVHLMVPPSVAVESEPETEAQIQEDYDAEESSSPNPITETPEPDLAIETNQLPGIYSETNLGYSFLHPMKYRILPEPLLTQTLEQLANPVSHLSFQGTKRIEESVLECISFQPCQLEKDANQDRCTMAEWEFSGTGSGRWRFVAVFDGLIRLCIDE